MNTTNEQARRYHWLSEGLQSFIIAPHAAIEGRLNEILLIITDERAQLSHNKQPNFTNTLAGTHHGRNFQTFTSVLKCTAS